ncbi:hypothetical protein Poli38472_004288 [Pythium oligandrum]|uniref:VASt domain-containing protein n=1 Tax=Pythium oligandrum TaxID=41045 RepID=A0A8K1FQE4_PYTOL|nr:hypothetical protein Poli38472_004288 [Pythium oligandrum]|eukprot:TMW66523.1 hypothetical protein Poli38472_004288 [Pythium oligandrum]
MEVSAFRSFKMALGMSASSSSVDDDGEAVDVTSCKPRADSAGSSRSSQSASSTSSSRSRSGSTPQRRKSRRRRSELNLPLDGDFVPLQNAEAASAANDPEDDDSDRVRDQVREEVICMIFDLPKCTRFYKDFSCAISAAFAMHGRMYPTSSHLCFYSNVFGRERKILIPYESITEVSKTTTMVFQHAIRIVTSTGEDYTFTGFWGDNRDCCYELIMRIRNRILGVLEDDLACPAAASSTAGSDDDVTCPMQRTVSDNSLTVAPRDISMTRLLEETMAVSCDDFLERFILDDATFGLDEFNRRIGSSEIKVNPWTAPSVDADGFTLGSTRSMQFRVPVESPIGPKSTLVDVVQCSKTEKNVRLIESSTRLVDIPYGDYFSVEDRWSIVPHPTDTNACTLTIELKVVFSKSTFWKSTIESRAIADNKTKWMRWVQMAKAHLGGEDVVEPSATTESSQPVDTQANVSKPETPPKRLELRQSISEDNRTSSRHTPRTRYVRRRGALAKGKLSDTYYQ